MKRLRALAGRFSEWLDRSAHVFLIGVIVACAVEVAVDWNATLRDINVLRASMRQKGENYLGVLRSAASEPLLAYDGDALGQLAQPLLDDSDVVYVRFSDALGNTVADRLRPDYARAFHAANEGVSFRDHYRHVMDRDTCGMIGDPALLERHMEGSRHRDFIQMWSDGMSALGARLRGTMDTPGTVAHGPRILYQDRLAGADGRLDRRITWAIGTVVAEDDEPFGVVLIALDQTSVNAASRSKLYQGLAMTVFFVGLIVLQNVSARRAKLRRLELEAALSSARAAIRGALPAVPALTWCDLGIGFAQDDRVGGTIYDLRASESSVELLLAVPEGAGVDAAFASVVLRDVYRRETRAGAPLEEQLWSMLRGYRASPLARPVDLLLLRIEPGRVSGIVAGLSPPSEMSDGALRPLPLGDPLTVPADVGPLGARPRTFNVALPVEALVMFDDGKPLDAQRSMARGEMDAMLTTAGPRSAQALADEAVAHAVRRTHGRHGDDFFALVVRPRASEPV